jgi:hypothetical protein
MFLFCDRSKDLVKVDDLLSAVGVLQKVSDETLRKRIVEVIQLFDEDRDGAVDVKLVVRVLELLGKENVKLSDKMIAELVDLVEKEDIVGEALPRPSSPAQPLPPPPPSASELAPGALNPPRETSLCESSEQTSPAPKRKAGRQAEGVQGVQDSPPDTSKRSRSKSPPSTPPPPPIASEPKQPRPEV